VTELANGGTDTVQTTLTSYTLGANVENLTFTGAGGFSGTGNALSNTIRGGSGADTMAGGAGNDTYVVDNALDVVTELAGAGTDTVQTTLMSYTLGANVENLTFIGSGSFTGTGNTLNNTLRGGSGADTLAGGAGNDIYIIDNALDVVIELAAQGTDTVQTTLSSYTLGANVESLTFIGSGSFSGTGNALNNVIRGGIGADTLVGGAGSDFLSGGAGADRLEGGQGNDTLDGGTGNDVFVFTAAGFGSDRVQGFDANAAGGQDLLDISGLGISAATFAAAVVITDVGNDTRITIGADSMLLLGIGDPANISANDFLLAA
jgi:Ca2+-binding RTX toxin-like protein